MFEKPNQDIFFQSSQAASKEPLMEGEAQYSWPPCPN